MRPRRLRSSTRRRADLPSTRTRRSLSTTAVRTKPPPHPHTPLPTPLPPHSAVEASGKRARKGGVVYLTKARDLEPAAPPSEGEAARVRRRLRDAELAKAVERAAAAGPEEAETGSGGVSAGGAEEQELERGRLAAVRRERKREKLRAERAAVEEAISQAGRVGGGGAARRGGLAWRAEVEEGVEGGGLYDLWGAEGEKVSEGKLGLRKLAGVPEEVKRVHADRGVHERKSVVHRPRTVPAEAPAPEAVPVPHGGMSYNPVVAEHEDLLGEATAVEEERLERIAKAAQKAKAKSDLAGVPDSVLRAARRLTDAERRRKVEEEQGGHTSFILGERRPRTKQQRRRQLEQAQTERRAVEEKRQRIFDEDAAGAKAIAKRIQAEGAAKEQERALSEQLRTLARRDAKPTVLVAGKPAPHKGPDTLLALQVPLREDLSGSLRLIKPATALIHPAQDLVHNLLVRDKIELGGRRSKKKFPRKKIVHKRI
jgi:Nop53 (60S ribosomal biogenesis)